MKLKPSSAKAKMRVLQQKVTRILREAFNLEDDDVRSTSSGASGEDVQLSPAARRVIPHQIECKKHNRFSVYGYIKQAKSHGRYEPLVVIEADRQRPLAIVDFEYFVKLLVAANTGNNNDPHERSTSDKRPRRRLQVAGIQSPAPLAPRHHTARRQAVVHPRRLD